MSVDCVIKGQPTTGTVSSTGLMIGGLVTQVALNSTTWTALPATPLSQRNAVALQNISNIDFVVNYDDTIVGYVGMLVAAGSERQYDITDSIILYGKSESGTPTINVEEIA